MQSSPLTAAAFEMECSIWGGEYQTAEEKPSLVTITSAAVSSCCSRFLQEETSGSPCHASAHPPGGTSTGWCLSKVLSSRVLGFTDAQLTPSMTPSHPHPPHLWAAVAVGGVVLSPTYEQRHQQDFQEHRDFQRLPALSLKYL